MVADPLVQRQSISGETSDYKSRQEYPRCGQRSMENTGGKDQRDSVDEEAGLFATSTSEGFYSEERRPENQAARHPRNDRPRHASGAPAGAGTRRGNHRRSEFLWIQTGALNR